MEQCINHCSACARLVGSSAREPRPRSHRRWPDPAEYRQDDRGGPPINLDAEIKVGRALKTLLLTPAQAATYLELERNDTRADREPEPSHPRWWMMTNVSWQNSILAL